jgi:D-alanyl-D-alanine carboxypeptidase
MPAARHPLSIGSLVTALSLCVLCGPAAAENGGAIAASALRGALSTLPEPARAAIQSRIDASPLRFDRYLSSALADRRADAMILYRVDKERALPERYSPGDLLALDGTGLSVSRAGHRLRAAALKALLAMDRAARADGITLLVSSSYRSYDYQVGLWDRGVKAEGEAETAASTARPGHSQHQLGTAVDFGSITDAFAETKASRWLQSNARRFGFSLSYPKGMTSITGYKWESWHYRFIGEASAALVEEYFGGVQQQFLVFLEGL